MTVDIHKRIFLITQLFERKTIALYLIVLVLLGHRLFFCLSFALVTMILKPNFDLKIEKREIFGSEVNTLTKLLIATEIECPEFRKNCGKYFLRFEGSKILFVLPVINKWDQIGFSCAVKLL
jgi:hypothetical protein